MLADPVTRRERRWTTIDLSTRMTRTGTRYGSRGRMTPDLVRMLSSLTVRRGTERTEGTKATSRMTSRTTKGLRPPGLAEGHLQQRSRKRLLVLVIVMQAAALTSHRPLSLKTEDKETDDSDGSVRKSPPKEKHKKAAASKGDTETRSEHSSYSSSSKSKSRHSRSAGAGDKAMNQISVTIWSPGCCRCS